MTAAIFRAPMAAVVLLLITVPSQACDATVISTPLSRTTYVYPCPSPEITLYRTPLSVAKIETERLPATETAITKPKTTAKPKKKKRCWYTNKRGQKRYRMRYSCS